MHACLVGICLATLTGCQIFASHDEGAHGGAAGAGAASGADAGVGGLAGGAGAAGVAGGTAGGGDSGGAGAAAPGVWTTMAPSPLRARGHVRAAFTGTQMLLWGGANCTRPTCVLGDGAYYDPAVDRWTLFHAQGALTGRADAAVVWTGSEMIVWGGYEALQADSQAATGDRYRPTSDVWVGMDAAGAASARSEPSTVWTGSEMIVWGGIGRGGQAVAGGAIYTPAVDRWRDITPTGAPDVRFGASAVWADTELIVWGGANSVDATDRGARYDPARDQWPSLPRAGAPSPRSYHAAVWAGDQMIVFGGQDTALTSLGTGARYVPANDRWMPVQSAGAPIPRSNMAAVWTGTEVLIFGGGIGTQAREQTDTGGRYAPATDTWTPTPMADAPSPRVSPAFAWTGTELVIWGGFGAMPTTPGGSDYLDTGARFRP